MSRDLERLEQEALEELGRASSGPELEAWHQKYLGRRGQLTLFMRAIGSLPPEKRPQAGQAGNRLRELLEARHREREAQVREIELAQTLAAQAVDVTLPGRRPWTGGLHPVTLTLRRMYDIFAEMGFQVFRSREVETDSYNFELLNMPPHHPARDMWDTFYVSDTVVLRTHTSPGQIHAMRTFYPDPIRVILPGKCYRYEQVTARSESMFYQVEGLAVGHSITLADLKGVMATFARRMYGPERRMRFRASYFPFTEPSVEVDMDCIICGGDGCRVCKQTGWVEIAGAGMVHPTVLRNGGYDPDEFSGFAFGMGPERVAMILNDVDDIRYFYGNDLRFLRQFGSLS
ncbi:MAG: phenylalanine--tRNA ligase subunit alpha [Anaerolineae bacterium]|nr:phenylalanine--tRNA ligase subunit alpha [Anaerolineae bacterium]